jgi:hypothetical protein
MFKVANLCTLGYAKGFTPWSYKTEDSLKEMLSKGYFDFAFELFQTNDIIFLCCPEGTAIRVIHVEDSAVSLERPL